MDGSLKQFLVKIPSLHGSYLSLALVLWKPAFGILFNSLEFKGQGDYKKEHILSESTAIYNSNIIESLSFYKTCFPLILVHLRFDE